MTIDFTRGLVIQVWARPAGSSRTFRSVRRCSTAALIEPGVNARLSLVELQADGRLACLRARWLTRP
jgi:hypothetical protein